MQQDSKRWSTAQDDKSTTAPEAGKLPAPALLDDEVLAQISGGTDDAGTAGPHDNW